MAHAHHAWFDKYGREIQEEYERLHADALDDPQKAGHGGEGTWARLLKDWLPPAYEVGTRKYIVPEEGSDTFETDIVVFSPSYPRPLRAREEVLAGGVAAAFGVKLTLDAAGIRDSAERAALLRRALRIRNGTPRSEMVSPFPVGLLAHSHAWKQPGSTPTENIARNLQELDEKCSRHPRETVDCVCVADVSTWVTFRLPYMAPRFAKQLDWTTPTQKEVGYAMTAITGANPDESPAPVAMLVANLLIRLSYADPVIKPLADGLRLTETLGSGEGPQRLWELADVFTDEVIAALPTRGLDNSDPEWSVAFAA
jgi:uncharacterized protein DUF6602